MIEQAYCVRVEYGTSEKATVIYGIIVSETDNFTVVKTARGEHTIRNDHLISMRPTRRVFKEGW